MTYTDLPLKQFDEVIISVVPFGGPSLALNVAKNLGASLTGDIFLSLILSLININTIESYEAIIKLVSSTTDILSSNIDTKKNINLIKLSKSDREDIEAISYWALNRALYKTTDDTRKTRIKEKLNYIRQHSLKDESLIIKTLVNLKSELAISLLEDSVIYDNKQLAKLAIPQIRESRGVISNPLQHARLLMSVALYHSAGSEKQRKISVKNFLQAAKLIENHLIVLDDLINDPKTKLSIK